VMMSIENPMMVVVVCVIGSNLLTYAPLKCPTTRVVNDP
jgi:hypothetical protein